MTCMDICPYFEERFLEGLAASNNPHIADDPSIALVVFNTFVLQNKLCAAVP